MSFAGVDPSDPGTNSGFDYSDLGANQRKAGATLPFGVGEAATVAGSLFGQTRGLLDAWNTSDEAYRARMDRQFNVDPTEDPGGALIDPKEWQTKYPDLGLTFTPDMGTAQAQLLVNHRQDELRRQYILDHSPDTLMANTARTLTDFAGQALDPVNIAAAFVPGVGETRAALWTAKYGKTLARIGEGVVAGATGTAALQPLIAGEASTFQDHYGPMDAFMNVAFGAALGGGLHAAAGYMSDVLSRASPETREAALRGAVGQLVEGRPVDVEPVLSTDGRVAEPSDRFAERETQLTQDLAQHDQGLSDLSGQIEAARTPVEPKAPATEDLTSAQAESPASQPAADLAELQSQHADLQTKRDATAQELNSVRAMRAQATQEETISGARSQIDRARQNSLDFAKGQEPSTVTMDPEASAAAGKEVAKGIGDDPEAELADAQERIKAYKDQGLISDEEHTAFNDANTLDEQASKTRTLAARRAAACLGQ